MMHGREKSDSAIVARKPTNKAVPTAAEPVERRVGAKGNANQQSTDRAQNRATVSQALERIRKVAKERKKERFTALFHHISIDLLDEAFYELKENAAAGVDGLTWRDYEQNLERNLEEGPACSCPSRSLPGTAGTARIHSQAGRAAAPARGRSP